MRQFSSWFPLSRAAIEAHAPDSGAVQVRRAGGELLEYPTGKSAMVCYLYSSDLGSAMPERFADEFEEPGSLGYGTLQWRFYGGAGAREHLLELLYRFEKNFGALPAINAANA